MSLFALKCAGLHGSREYFRTRELSFSKKQLGSKSWMLLLLHDLEQSSQTSPLSSNEIENFLKVLSISLKNSHCHSVLNEQITALTRKKIFQFFFWMEELLSELDQHRETYKYRLSRVFRGQVIKFLEHQHCSDAITKRTVGFKTKFDSHAPPRSLISDLENDFSDPDLATPVGALTHQNLPDLMKKAEARLKADIDAVREACIAELKACAGLRQRLQLLNLEDRDPAALKTCLLMIQGKLDHEIGARFVGSYSYDDVLGMCQQLIAKHRLAYIKRAFNPHFFHHEKIWASIFPEQQIHLASATFKLHYLPYRVINAELTACFVLLLTYTNWNGNSLFGLSADLVDLQAEHAWIQGFKGKTGEYTDKVYIDKSQPYALEAIRLLMWNRAQLIELGYLNGHCQWLWCGWPLKYNDPHDAQKVSFHVDLGRLQAAYNLPRFTVEQIRPQILAYEAIRLKSVEYVRQLAQHRELSTSGHYLDQLIVRRLNEAISLEFQRRLENTVLYRLSLSEPQVKDLVITRHIDERLLTPVGDGTSCSNPYIPPESFYLSAGVCDGKRCHLDEGCPNRKIILDYEALRALVKKRQYYLHNWQRLERKNPSAFEKFHIPAILFTLGLFDYVKAGAFKHVLDRIVKEVDSEKTKK